MVDRAGHQTAPARPAEMKLPPLREVISRYGLRAKKGLGQNFLLDLNLTRRIVRAAGNLEGVEIIEIGPGPGGLTRALLETNATRVIAIERDQRCIGALRELEAVYPGRLIVVADDALNAEIAQFVTGRTKVVANLPYNIATAMLINWIPSLKRFEGLTLMFQKEVADRLAASPGTRAFGRLSVLVQWIAQVTRHFDVPPSAFVPQPKVMSTVVGITPREVPVAPADREILERVTAAAFGQRRKMLRSSLRALDVDVMTLLETAGVAPTDRPENLGVEAFCAIARALKCRDSGS